MSVCIVTYRRPEFLSRCLRSLEGVREGVEIVIVDASPMDATKAVLEQHPRARYVHAPDLAGRMTRSRNEALKYAQGDIICFLDDDVVVSAGWMDGIRVAFDDPTVTAVGGRTRNRLPGEATYSLPIGRLQEDGTLTEGFAAEAPRLVEIDHGIGANMAFRRSVLARLGGFRDDYPGTALREDTDVFLRIKRLGGRAVFAPEAVVDHLPAPHVRGARFDTRYKLYGRRNHMVLLARHQGLASSMVRRWVVQEFLKVLQASTLSQKSRRWGVTTIGVVWGGFAMLRLARLGPLRPERSDRDGRELRATLSS